MAYDPKRSRGRATPAPHVEDTDPAPVDGILDGRIEVPEPHDVPAVVETAPVEPVAAVEHEVVEPETVRPAAAEPVAAEPEPAAVDTEAPAAPRSAPQSEPPVAAVPDSAGSRWIFLAFIAAILAVIVWRLRRRAAD